MSEKQCKEADQFAMAILMPPKLVKNWERTHGRVTLANDALLEKFAADFQVPLGVAGIRLAQLHRTTKKIQPQRRGRVLGRYPVDRHSSDAS